MSDIEELERLLEVALEQMDGYEGKGPAFTPGAARRAITDALSLLEGDTVLMTTDTLTELLKKSVELGISEAFGSIGLKLEPPAEEPTIKERYSPCSCPRICPDIMWEDDVAYCAIQPLEEVDDSE